MSWRVEFRPEVEEDVAEAAAWYEARQPGLGAAFVEELIVVWDALAENPFANSRRHPKRDIRWRYPERFPYRVVYEGAPFGLGVSSRVLTGTFLESDVAVPSEMYAVSCSRLFSDPGNGVIGLAWMDPYYSVIGPERSPLHGPGYNMLFCDGRVAFVKRNDCLYPPRTARQWNRDHEEHTESWAPAYFWQVGR